MNGETAPGPRGAREEGFSLAEILGSMVILAVLALAFLPVAMHTAQAAAGGTTLSTATRLVSKQLELVRATPLTTCPPAGAEPIGSLVETVTDPRGVELQTWTKFEGTCSSNGLIRYVVTVTRSSAPGTPVATASTFVTVQPS